MGGAIGAAILTSIQTSVQISHGGPTSFSGRAAGLWFLFAFLTVMGLFLLVFMKDTVGPVNPNAPKSDMETDEEPQKEDVL